MNNLKELDTLLIRQLSAKLTQRVKKATVLLVDDDSITRELIAHQLSHCFEVDQAYSGLEAIEYCNVYKPDIVLLDVEMPGIDGLEVCRKIRTSLSTHAVPVVFITAHTGIEAENACWDAGGSDFVTKPINTQTLIRRLQSHLSSKFSNEMLEDLAFRDGLTGVYNKRYFNEVMPSLLSFSQRSNTEMALIMIDVDNFKHYNDRYGHLAGDRCLQEVSKVVTHCLKRPTDIVARFGGEEFVCIMPNTNKMSALAMCQHILTGVEHMANGPDKTLKEKVTVSIGLALNHQFDQYPAGEELLNTADANLYQAKSMGKNRVVL
ncbi:diguanylate cyclase [Alteromonas sediminis]|uniref:diguanylate cyclase n=1 Tax=Alteromonas sediminis TaxID=2259342 RepID=A0A3N5Y3X5_9ALTE|nr:diguanylate cyclase [Alteromonas sediminis]RPJ68090.1 diguanylate cyclase [Alteromonas sediminis]